MLRLFTSPALIVSSTEPIVTRSVTDREQPLLQNDHRGLDVLSSVTAPSTGSPGDVISLITPLSCVPSDDVPSAKCPMFRPAPKTYATWSHVASLNNVLIRRYVIIVGINNFQITSRASSSSLPFHAYARTSGRINLVKSPIKRHIIIKT